MSFCLFILGNGRKGYLERTVASWESNLVGTPKHKIIFDDSGNPSHLKWLRRNFGDRFDIVPVGPKAMGQKAAIQFIFNYINNLDVDYVIEVEEDWMLFRPLDVNQITKVLDSKPNILQMRIPRTVWYAPYHVLDINAGSILKHHIEIPGTTHEIITEGKNSWYEWRGDFYFWSHNPSIYSKRIISESYLNVSDQNHEYEFGKNLMSKYPNAVTGFWASNPYEGYITHIGIKDDAVLNQLPSFSTVSNNPKLAVVIPWREQPSRVPAFNAVVAWYKENLPEAKFYYPNHPGEVWLPSATRNDGVRMAEADDIDVIIMSDADTIPEIGPLRESIAAAAQDGMIHNPYTRYRMLGDVGTREHLELGKPLAECAFTEYSTPCSGVNVFTPEAWWKLGGMDEKFKQWGYEDTAMQVAHRVINKTNYIKHKGITYSMGHEPQPRTGKDFMNNKMLFDEYANIVDPKAMLELVAREYSLPTASRLKILAYVNNYLPKVIAGAELMLHQTLLDLKNKGHEVVVASKEPEVSEVDGIQIINNADLTTLGAKLNWCDIVVTQLGATPNAIKYSSNVRKPLVNFLHNDYQIKTFGISRRNSKLAVANSDWVAEDSNKSLPTITLHPPTDPKLYSGSGTKDGAITMINLTEEKGATTFWQLARLMPERQFIAVLGGYGQQVIHSPTPPNVTILENTDDIQSVYKKTSIIIMPSNYESWGRVAVEAMAFGIPVIAAPTHGLKESLGDAGSFAMPYDIATYMDKIRALDDKAAYSKASKLGKQRAKDLYELYLTRLENLEETFIKIKNRLI